MITLSAVAILQSIKTGQSIYKMYILERSKDQRLCEYRLLYGTVGKHVVVYDIYHRGKPSDLLDWELERDQYCVVVLSNGYYSTAFFKDDELVVDNTINVCFIYDKVYIDEY